MMASSGGGERTVFVLDRDNVPRPVQKGTLRHQYVQGNLSDRLQISQDGDHFEPIETAAWFLDDSGDTPANAASIGVSDRLEQSSYSSITTPGLSLNVAGGVQEVQGDTKSKRAPLTPSLNRLRPTSIKGTLLGLKTQSSTSTSRVLGMRTSSTASGPAHLMVPDGEPRFKGPGSPSGSRPEGAMFLDKGEDFPESLKTLQQELAQSLARAEALNYHFENSYSTLRTQNDDVRAENATLKNQIEVLKGLITEQAPSLVETMNANLSRVTARASQRNLSSPPSTGSLSRQLSGDESGQVESTATPSFGIPFDPDSPMLREKMEMFEAQLDEVRQSVKTCVKSGMAFVQAFPIIYEAGGQFAEDLQQSTLPMLKVLGEALAKTLDGQYKLLENVHEDFLQPLARFANNDLKSANHLKAELERKREIFESLESKYMSNRRGKDRTSGASWGSGAQLIVSSGTPGSGQTEGTPRHNRGSSGNVGSMLAGISASGDAGGSDSRGQNMELKIAEAQHELARCKLIYTLNHLAMNHRVIVNRCAISLAKSMSSYHQTATTRLATVLDNAKVLGAEEPEEMEKLISRSEAQFKRKQQEIEALNFGVGRRVDAEKDLIHEGWLWKRSSNVIRDWKKRFFQIVGGQLVYFRNMKRELVCDVHLCTVRDVPRTSSREAAPPRTSFEVISNKRSLVLMAATEEEKDVWVAAIRRAIEKSLGSGVEAATGTTSAGSGPSSGIGASAVYDGAYSDFMEDDSNHKCFECGCTLDSPNWVSINLGVFLCIECSGVHRSLGTHLTKVRSLQLDKLPSSQLDILRRLGNGRAAKIWEANQEAVREWKSSLMYSRASVDQFIKEKYVNKAFVVDTNVDASPEAFEMVLIEDNLKRIAWFVAHLKAPFYLSLKTTALHVAASEPTTSAALCEFLLLNGADLGALDEQGRTPSDIANERASTKAQSVFRCWAANTYMKTVAAEDM